MNKKVLITLFALLVVSSRAFAAFDDVQLTTGSTLQLTVGSSVLDFTVASGNVQDLTVDASSLNFTLAAGSSIGIASSNKTSFNYGKNNAIANFSCGSSSSELSFSLAPSLTAEVVTVTPTGSTCVAPDSSGGGGSASVTEPTQTSATSPTSTPAPVTVSVPAPAVVAQASATIVAPVVAKPSPVAQAVSSVFNVDLQRGMRNDDVKRLQQLLGVDATGYYGPLTEKSVREFQAKNGLPQVGRVGPATRAKLEDVLRNPDQILQKQLDDLNKQLENLRQQL